MRNLIIKIIDNSFIIFVLFLFNFLWCRYFFSLFVALLLSFLLTLGISMLILNFKERKESKLIISKKEQKLIEDVKNYFIFSSLENIKQSLGKKLNAKFVSDNIFEMKGDVFYLCPKILDEQTLIEIIKTNQAGVVQIFCADCSKEAFALIKKIKSPKISVIDAKRIVLDFGFNLEDVSSQVVLNVKEKISLKEFALLFIREENAKGYLISAIILMLSTLIIRQKIFYYFFISILLVLSLVCKLLPKINKMKKR